MNSVFCKEQLLFFPHLSSSSSLSFCLLCLSISVLWQCKWDVLIHKTRKLCLDPPRSCHSWFKSIAVKVLCHTSECLISVSKSWNDLFRSLNKKFSKQNKISKQKLLTTTKELLSLLQEKLTIHLKHWRKKKKKKLNSGLNLLEN